ncbi:multidrug effflux MFS transporter [Aestuariivirga sp.]|uniref:multidrug effflux MFS transporter n=1 Tax=Aestuariivirga sp. TaxID=2650926 RepID=UPI0039E2C8B1
MQQKRPAEFIALVALLTAMVAMSIDTMLPAIGLMATELGASHPNDRQLIVLGFFAGLMFGTLIFGPISDSIGRKRTIYVGLVLFVAGCFLCAVSTSFPMLIAARMLQGFGAASPRVCSIAMVRDGAGGAAMARIMSFVMSVFMLVPILAPSIGQLVLFVTSWRIIFLGFIAMALMAGLWLALRQEETLAPEKRIAFSAARLAAGAAEVMRNPVSLGNTIAVGFIFAAFNAYLGTSQQIFAEQYGQGAYFALWFGGLAMAIALAMIVNGRLVMRLGMRKLAKYALYGFLAAWAVMVVAVLASGGHPPLVMLGVVFFCSFFCSGMLFGNFNAMALEPMGHIAGMAAAISGSLSSAIGVFFGAIAGRFYDGSMYPLAFAFFAFGIVSYVFAEWAARASVAASQRVAQKTGA